MDRAKKTVSPGFALVTGASAGIGAEFSRQLTGYEGLILVARREERLQALATELRSRGYRGTIEVRVCDLRRFAERQALVESVSSLPVSLLVNNAGFGFVGVFTADSSRNILDMIATNCEAPLHLARELLPGMLARGSGAILNVASIAAFAPLPFMATYGATKALLTNWSVALREELRGTGVRVLALCPGPTESEFHLVAGVREKIAVVPAADTASVVAQALEALKNDRSVCITGFANRMLSEATRLLPRALISKVARRLLESRVPPERRVATDPL
jgi:short-subunit dehydrogenase